MIAHHVADADADAFRIDLFYHQLDDNIPVGQKAYRLLFSSGIIASLVILTGSRGYIRK